MLTQIRKSTAFQNDLKRYNMVLEKISDDLVKNEFQKLISALIQEVKRMDDLHSEMIYNKQMPSLGTEKRSNIMQIRKQLEQRVKEFKLDSEV